MTKARPEQPERTADLSDAARAVVRDPGDPRIDAHLAAMGLGPDPAPPPPLRLASAERAELDSLRHEVDELRGSLVDARRRVRLLLTALVLVLVTDAVLVLLVVSRLG